MKTHRLALGTVQFGLDYGINNKQGQVSYSEIEKILITAAEHGITTLDTAEAYGNSESQLGKFIKDHPTLEFDLVSKYNFDGVKVSSAGLERSLVNLSTQKLYGYMAHDFRKFNRNLELIRQFVALKNTCIEKIGFSLYYPQDLEFLLQNNIKFDIVQVPYNIFDQRFESYFGTLHKLNVEIHTRSCFLQGLFFMEIENLPEKLLPLKDKLLKIKKLAIENNISIQALALVFCLSDKLIDKVVIGVDNLLNLKDNIFSAGMFVNDEILEELKQLNEENEQLILPFNW